MTTIRDLFAVEQQQETLVLTPRGDIAGFRDLDVHNQVQTLHETIDSGTVRNLIVDLGNSKYFGTVVIGIICSLAQKIREKGGQLVLCHVSDDMSQIFKVMRLDEGIPRFDNLKIALKFMNKVETARTG